MTSEPPVLCTPPFTLQFDLSPEAQWSIDPSTVPTKPGVFVIENEVGVTLALTATANLRRTFKARLNESQESAPQWAQARVVRAVTVGSAFEADWVFLQLARIRLPASYRAMLDRYQGWFIHCDPEARFPRWVKTAQPGCAPTGRVGVYLGPFPDKHAAQRFIEMLENSFDLCRYHHILVQAPNATACAYKEMGRCPAPCDGTVSMESYRGQINAAVQLASTPFDQWKADLKQAIQQASDNLDFESATLLQRRLEDAGVAGKPQFAFVDRLERFRFVGVLPSERPERARIFLILGGSVEPFVDVQLNSDSPALAEIVAAAQQRAEQVEFRFSEQEVDNIALVSWHLFRQARSKAPGAFVKLDETLDPKRLAKVLRKLTQHQKPTDNSHEIDERVIDSIEPTDLKPPG